MKVELRLILDALPQFQEQGKVEYARLMEAHQEEINQINADLDNSLKRVKVFKEKDAEENATFDYPRLEKLNREFYVIKERAKVAKSRDQIMNIDTVEFIGLADCEWYFTQMFAFWKIVNLVATKAKKWKPVPFSELEPDKIAVDVANWQRNFTKIINAFNEKIPDNPIVKVS